MNAPVRTVLVHGAWHDGSCWAPVVRRLTAAGRDVHVVDLPGNRPGTPSRTYIESVLDVVGPGDGVGQGRVVLVGHSAGGLVVPAVAQALGADRVAAMVLVAALVPRPGMSWQERARSEQPMVAGFGRGQRRHDDGTTWWPEESAAAELYAGVAQEYGPGGEEAVQAAVAALRPQDWTLTREAGLLATWPAVRTVLVICADDRVVDPSWSCSAAGVVPGAEVVELAGGHFPMLTRPAELAALIDSVIAAADPAAADPAGGLR